MKTTLLSLVLLLIASAGAQGLERAEELLSAAQRFTVSSLVRTFDVTATKKVYFIEEVVERSRKVVDVGRQRLYVNFDDEDTKFTLRLADGLTSLEMGGRTTLSPGAFWERIAEEILAQPERGFGVIPKDYTVVSYDGFKRYGDFAEGEQVTLRYTTPLYEQLETKFVFDVLGKPVAAIVDDGFLSDDDLILYDITTASDGSQMTVKTKIYMSWEEEGFLLSDEHQHYLFNQPVDQFLFVIGNNRRL